MKAYELHEKEGLEGLTQVERPSPSIGAGDVRVHVRAVSLNFRDLGIAKLRRKPGAERRVPTSDGRRGVSRPGVRRVKVGAGSANFSRLARGPLSDHTTQRPGAHRRHAGRGGGVPESSWVPLPEHLSFEAGATLPCAAVTAFHALFESATLRPGETVLLQGTGGVSIFALQLAKAAGARAIVTSSSADKRARAAALGADTARLQDRPTCCYTANAWRRYGRRRVGESGAWHLRPVGHRAEYRAR